MNIKHIVFTYNQKAEMLILHWTGKASTLLMDELSIALTFKLLLGDCLMFNFFLLPSFLLLASIEQVEMLLITSEVLITFPPPTPTHISIPISTVSEVTVSQSLAPDNGWILWLETRSASTYLEFGRIRGFLSPR